MSLTVQNTIFAMGLGKCCSPRLQGRASLQSGNGGSRNPWQPRGCAAMEGLINDKPSRSGSSHFPYPSRARVQWIEISWSASSIRV